MKIYKMIFVISFFLILIIPTCFINLKENQISEIDNSKLPEISTIQDKITFQNYFSKRIGFRKEMINAYTYLNDLCFKEMIHPSYTYGTDGYVFFKMGNEGYDDTSLYNLAYFIKNMQDYVTQRGKYFLFVINPTKISVYSQYLPKGYNYTNHRVNVLKKNLDELGVNYIDNTDCLKKASEKEQVFNVKYDAGHWNENGAFYGINNIYSKMQNDGINISKVDIGDYNISTELKESLPASEFKINEKVPLYELKNKNYTINFRYNDNIEISANNNYFVETSNSSMNTKLLFFRGSYMGDNKEKFVANKFSNAYFVHNYDNSINFDYYFNISEPDVVLFETVEYTINETFYSSEKMRAKKYNKVYSNYEKLQKNNTLIHVNNDDIIKKIEKNAKENIPLTKITLEDGNYEYAYLKINDKVYDFCYENEKSAITMDTEKLKNASNIEIIAISKDLKSQQEIKIK